MEYFEALSTVSKMCQIVFDNEESFCEEFTSLKYSEDIINVSFSGSICFVKALMENGSTGVFYFNVHSVLQWMEKIGVEL